ncbi:hypothetical protein OG342_14990 [Streptomyces bobili]|uniref:hypothetical protein n=1 Tax=Streptomyces bobili TaxID=67280 RepID=UPI002254A0BF|nr:hypothetical protein [Streptomyces bobili]MCX5524161.1 hypothetical protein [Streptomyces bobili]
MAQKLELLDVLGCTIAGVDDEGRIILDDGRRLEVARVVRPRGKVLDFSKPLPVHDEETGEYLGYWMGPGGVRIEAPDDAVA